jgi:hypothetical protein
MARKHNQGEHWEKDPPWIYTTHDGRKFIRSNEFVKLERVREQLRKAKKLTEPGSKLVKG